MIEIVQLETARSEQDLNKVSHKCINNRGEQYFHTKIRTMLSSNGRACMKSFVSPCRGVANRTGHKK